MGMTDNKFNFAVGLNTLHQTNFLVEGLPRTAVIDHLDIDVFDIVVTGGIFPIEHRVPNFVVIEP